MFQLKSMSRSIVLGFPRITDVLMPSKVADEVTEIKYQQLTERRSEQQC